MKAWLVREKDEFLATVVFAETRGKARSIARYTNACEDCGFCDIEVHRKPNMDKYYKDGKMELDWEIPQDRIALVKELGFQCAEIEYADCDECSAKGYCDLYKDYAEELKNG